MIYGYARLSPNENKDKHEKQLAWLRHVDVEELITEELPLSSRRKPILESIVGNIFEVDNWKLKFKPPIRVEGKLKQGDWLAVTDLSRIGNNVGAAGKVVDEILLVGAGIHLVEAGIKIKSEKEIAYKMLKAAAAGEWKVQGDATAHGIINIKKKKLPFGRPMILSKSQIMEVYKMIDEGKTQIETRDAMRAKHPELSGPDSALSQPTISRLLAQRRKKT